MNNKISHCIAGTMSWGLYGKNLSVQDCSTLIENYKSQNINTFDLADIYGGYTTEQLFGNALKKTNTNRQDVILISKCGIASPSSNNNYQIKHYDYSKEYIIKAVERSLRLIQSDYLDILLLHRPSPLLNVAEVAEAYQELSKKGMVKEIGVSNFLPLQIDLLKEYIPVKYNQLQFSVTHHQDLSNGTFEYLQKNLIQPMAWNPLGSFYKIEQNIEVKNKFILFCNERNLNPNLVLLAWIKKHPAAIIPVLGTTNIFNINSLHQLAGIKLSTEEWFEIYTIFLSKNVP